MNCSDFQRGAPCDTSYRTTISKRMNFILDNFDFSDDPLILDIGCGQGVYLNKLSEHVTNCIGIDFIDHDFAGNRQSSGKDLAFIRMSAENLGFKSGTFDKIIMIEAIEHLFNDTKALDEAYRVLKPSGSIVLTAPNKLFPLETHGMKIGSKVISSHGFGFPILPYMPFILRKYISNAKVYLPSGIVRLLANSGFHICTVDFLMPNLDKLRKDHPDHTKLITFIQKCLERTERSYFRNFSETIIICARKV